jgi:hypothetical protein
LMADLSAATYVLIYIYTEYMFVDCLMVDR